MNTKKRIFSLNIRNDRTCGNVFAFLVEKVAAGDQDFFIARRAKHV
ncbi:hypothetical protein U724_19920 [Pseudomonas chlororaphis subsp. aurantiaca PB-St2]|nr:hypothetical protein U724_19920 [Pseudomonas chlororaphis subsp. aurantiaca PB-St2]